ncbi:O-antigen ligase family protein [Streptomyces sp. NPDC002671]
MPIPFQPSSLLLACTVLVALGMLVAVFVRCPGIGIGLLSAAEAWEVVSREPLPVLSLSINVSPLDVLVVCAVLAAGITLLKGGSTRLHLARLALGALFLLVLGSLVSGVELYGIRSAGNDARAYFLYVLGAACYVAVVCPGRDLMAPVMRVWITLAGVYSLCSLLGWSRFGVRAASSAVVLDGKVFDGRPVPPAAALVIAQAAVMLLCLRRRRGPALAIPLLIVVVLLQHRTVWVAAAAMFGGWLLLRPGRAASKVVTMGATALAATTAALLMLLLPDDQLTGSLAESASNEGTLDWRIAGWTQLLGRLRGAGHWLFGLPFGSGYERLSSAGIVEVSPHNYYLHLLLRVGLVGLVTLAVAIVTSLRAAGRDTSTGVLFWLLVAGEACYCMAYAPVLSDGLLLGLLVRQASRTPQPEETAGRKHRGALRRTRQDRAGYQLAHRQI